MIEFFFLFYIECYCYGLNSLNTVIVHCGLIVLGSIEYCFYKFGSLQEFNAGLFDYLIATDDSHTKEKDEAAKVNIGELQRCKKQVKKKLDSEFGVVRGIDFKNVYTVSYLSHVCVCQCLVFTYIEMHPLVIIQEYAVELRFFSFGFWILYRETWLWIEYSGYG